MPTATFKCKRCKRSFIMAAHLARHMSTIHASTKKISSATTTKKVKRSTVQPKVVRTVATSRARVFAGPEGIIGAMQAHHSGLLSQRTSLDAQIDAVAQAMKAIGATTPMGRTSRVGKKRARPVEDIGRPGSLKKYIVRVLRQSSKPMSLQDIGTRVTKAGFKTKSKNLIQSISNRLTGLKSVKRVGYGKYQMAG